MNDKTFNKISECQKLMAEAIESYNNKGKQSDKLHEIRVYRGQIPEDVYKKIENFVNEYIRPMVYDFDYFSFLKDENYGSYDENNNNHFIIDSDWALEHMEIEQSHHIMGLRKKLEDFATTELSSTTDKFKLKIRKESKNLFRKEQKNEI